MADFGGHILFTFNGAPMTIRGKFEIDDGDFETDIITNEDGSISQTAKPQSGFVTCEFEDSDPADNSQIFDWNAFMTGGPYNFGIAEQDTNILHTLTGAKLKGKPKRDRLTGMVTGIQMHWPRGGYKMMNT